MGKRVTFTPETLAEPWRGNASERGQGRWCWVCRRYEVQDDGWCWKCGNKTGVSDG